MNAGDACVFTCTFCYVPDAVLNVTAAFADGDKLTASGVTAQVKKFLNQKGIAPKKSKGKEKDARAAVREDVRRLEADLAKFVPTERFRPLLDQILGMIESEPSDDSTLPKVPTREVAA